jgi:hypothetical protein
MDYVGLNYFSIAVGKMLKSVLGWDEERVEEAKKNGANRREGVNNAARHGATSVELDRQGGWTNSHSSSRTEKPNVRDQHYMDVQSNIGAMLCSAGYKRDELPTAAGRSLIPFDSVSGAFFGPVIGALKAKLNEISSCTLPSGHTGIAKKNWQSDRARLAAGYRNMSAIFVWFDQVLCQDLPILQHFYPTLPSWSNRIFHSLLWTTHCKNALTFYVQFNTKVPVHNEMPDWVISVVDLLRETRVALEQRGAGAWALNSFPSLAPVQTGLQRASSGAAFSCSTAPGCPHHSSPQQHQSLR